MKLIDRLPLLTRTEAVTFGQRHVSFHRDEILIWLSVGLPGEHDPQRISPAFPAVLYFARFPHTRTPKTAEKMRGPSNNGPFGGFGKPAQKAANP